MPIDPTEHDVTEERRNDTTTHTREVKKKTPLPLDQLGVLFLQRFCESASTFVIYPFLHELLASVLGDESSVGYYAGLMDSVRHLVSFVTMMYWSRLSDTAGRKPVLALGTFALAVSTASIGISKTFAGLLLSRCIFTALNSNAGIIRATIGEITDHTNSADAFALHHIPWAVGSSFGSFVGGWLVHPEDRFPSWFAGTFWAEYPYLLPCLTMAILSLVVVLLILRYLRETVPNSFFYRLKANTVETQPLLSSHNTQRQSPPPTSEPTQTIPLHQLLTKRTLPPLLSYTILLSLHATFNTLQAIFLAAPIHLGGLSLPPSSVGQILGTYGFVASITQLFFLGRPVRFFGVKRLYTYTTAGLLPMFLLPIWMNMIARRSNLEEEGGGLTPLIWALLAAQMSSVVLIDFAYSCSYLYITAASPSQRALGAINGVAQTLGAIGRMAAPGLAMGLVTYSVQQNILGGYFANVLLGLVAMGGVCMVVSTLPSTLDYYNVVDETHA